MGNSLLCHYIDNCFKEGIILWGQKHCNWGGAKLRTGGICPPVPMLKKALEQLVDRATADFINEDIRMNMDMCTLAQRFSDRDTILLLVLPKVTTTSSQTAFFAVCREYTRGATRAFCMWRVHP